MVHQRQIKKSASTTSTPRRIRLAESGRLTNHAASASVSASSAEIRRKPTLRFLQADTSADRVALYLIQVDLADREVARVRV